MTRRLISLVLLALAATSLGAQSIDDSLMVAKKAVFTGVSYGHDEWSKYWEGTLKRANGNVGTLTTETVTFTANYGLFDRLNLIALLPFVKTEASGGTLSPQDGLQDLTLAAKYRVFSADIAKGDSVFQGFAVASYGVPVSDYVADLLPLSIGLHSQRASGRATLNFTSQGGLFADATAAYTLRDKVTLDRPAYYTDGQLFLTDEVSMPDVFDYTLRVGYMKHRLMIPVSYSEQKTQGGGDIRRQDMPFVSNRMNFTRLDAMVRYTLPKPANLAVQVAAMRVLTGRNVGQSTAVQAALLYTIHFSNK